MSAAFLSVSLLDKVVSFEPGFKLTSLGIANADSNCFFLASAVLGSNFTSSLGFDALLTFSFEDDGFFLTFVGALAMVQRQVYSTLGTTNSKSQNGHCRWHMFEVFRRSTQWSQFTIDSF